MDALVDALNDAIPRVNGAVQSPAMLPCTVARVIDVQDPDNLSRVKVRLASVPGDDDSPLELWARVSVPVAGDNYGHYAIPGVGDEVLVSFINGDNRFPIVIGSLWNGGQQIPEAVAGNDIDAWSFTSRQGSKISVKEGNSESNPTIDLTTAGGVNAKLTDQGGGKISLDAAGSTIELSSSGVKITTGGSVEVNASTMSVSAGSVSVDTSIATFSGVVSCNTLQASTVVATTYTPGAGNVW